MAVLTVQDMPVAGFVGPTLVAADAAGDEAPSGAGVFAYITNGSASAVTVDFDVPVGANAAVTISKSIPAGDDLYMPLPVRNLHPHASVQIKDVTTNLAAWTYSAVTSVQVAVVRAP